ncbi:coiled-coil domain-containing protein 157 isoform X2 [Hyla sarda]|nr:coiled-coil domain-containing protein 157 isoform X2 [Hyla sarda]XP_056384643.1 coiled-coil domain-containing protein 157 isoform X2 [Hyla sarda]XP_056384644.1 coiled-coil domain-containing protein 157 isoform X2 [Hyla sarda]XP_056384645.1 coiled-coil domain-containing protein 157 isoform X2 [Hyla sarda]XP_056384646.1 coiled-coil domain-containing protein 157 isoform X2 [Hyla sarda]
MAGLLGDRTCMESLRKDITDLQGTLIDVFSRVGAVRFPSWKFPDKTSCDLDLVQLLDRYDFVEDDTDYTQLSHMVLLELVIDRLLLILQSFEVYTELISSDGSFIPPRDPGPSMSIGLTVRKYWSNMLKLGTLYQKGKCSSLENVIMAKEPKTPKERSCLSSGRAQSVLSCTESRQLTYAPQGSNLSIAKDTCTVGSQTLESALIPCDACAIAQCSLKEVSDAIVSVCKSQNLPSTLIKIQEVLPSEGIMSPSEMRYWANEESKDLGRISKHLTKLTQLIQPLRNQCDVAKLENQRLQQSIEDYKNQLKLQKDELQRQVIDHEKKLLEKGQQNQEVVDRLERDKNELRKGSTVLEERVSILKEELKLQHCTIRDLELARQKLLGEMQTMVHKEEVSILEKKVGDLTVHLENTLQRLKESEESVSKERARGESLQNHKESLQAKQKSLLQQLDRISQECENLRGMMGDADEEKANLEEQIEQMQREEESLRSQIKEQQDIINTLQQGKVALEKSFEDVTNQLTELQVNIQEHKKREKLLVCYPDLHPLPEFESSGDITEDMEKQLQANSIRISVLEEENAKLRVSLHKLGAKGKQGALKVIPQTRLWTLPTTVEPLSPEPQIQSSGRSSTTKPPSPKLNTVTPSKDTMKSETVVQPERKGSHHSLNLVTFPPDNSPIAAYARVKQVKGRNSSDRK